MEHSKAYRSLLIAVVMQAVHDYYQPSHRADVVGFIESQGFSWLWDALLDDMLGLPSVDEVRTRFLYGDLPTGRRAYHHAS